MEASREQRVIGVIRAFLGRYDEDRARELTLSTRVEDLALDSLDRVELAMDIEEEFEPECAKVFEVDDQLGKHETVGELVMAICEQLKRLEA